MEDDDDYLEMLNLNVQQWGHENIKDHYKDAETGEYDMERLNNDAFIKQEKEFASLTLRVIE